MTNYWSVRSHSHLFADASKCANFVLVCCRILRPRTIDDYFDQIQTFHNSASLSAHQLYRAWLGPKEVASESEPLLQLVGKPDTGKTVLMKGAVLSESNDPTTIILHHFFDRNASATELTSPSRSTYTIFLRSLLGQLLFQVPHKPLKDIRSWGRELQSDQDAGLWSNNRLQTTITQIILANSASTDPVSMRYRIFIDAINDCPNDKWTSTCFTPNSQLAILLFAADLASTAQASGVDLRICISREHVPRFGKREPKASIIEVDKCMSGTVDRYIQEQLRKLEDDDLAFRIHLRLRQKIGDGILWATVVTQGILEMYETATVGEIEQFAEEVTKDVDAVYESILKSGSNGHMLEFFTIGLGALRPLMADQFRHALAFTEDFRFDSIEDWESSPHGLKPGKMFENRLRHETRGMMEVVKFGTRFVSGESGRAATDQVRFSNGAFERFLRKKNGLSALAVDSSVSLEKRCHLFLFQVCTRVLDLCSLRGSDTVHMLDYASECWLRHARGCQDLFSTMTELPEFMRNCKSRKTARVIEETIKALRRSQEKEAQLLDRQNTMLVLLSTIGCTSLLRQHLQTCIKCEEACKSDESDPTQLRTALLNAIIGRHFDTASFLLENRANGDINELFSNATVLYDAAYFASCGKASDQAQRLDLVRFLISRGADPAVHSMMSYEYPLHAAIALGNKLLIEELLKPSAAKAEQLIKLPLKRRGCKGWTALHFAVNSGRTHRDKLSVLRTVLKLAPKNVGLLSLEDAEGNTPIAMAVNIEGSEGEDLAEAFEDFEIEEEEAALRNAREQRSSSAPAGARLPMPKNHFGVSAGPEEDGQFPFPRRRKTR
jgi:hypothetical protein